MSYVRSSGRQKRRQFALHQLVAERLEPRELLDAHGLSLSLDKFELRQNQPETVLDVLGNDAFDADYIGAKLISDVSPGSQGGRLRIASDGKSLFYRPPADFAGKETFHYFVDGLASAAVQIEVTAPLRADSFTLVPDESQVSLDVLANDPFWSDYAGPRKITLVSASSLAAEIAISADGHSLVYTLPEGAQGADRFTYIVDDLYPATVAVSLIAPLTNDRYEVVEQTVGQRLEVLTNDPFWASYTGDRKITHVLDVSDMARVEMAPSGHELIYSSQHTSGAWETFRYVVDNRFEASVTIYVVHPVVDDYSQVDSNSVNFPINVTANDFYTTLSGSKRDIVDRVTSVTESDNGGATAVSADGQSILYTPPAGFQGQDQFTYTADGKYVATVRVQVSEPVRDDLLIAYQGTQNNLLAVRDNDFLGNGYQGQRLITAVTPASAGGLVAISLDRRTVVYTPPADFSGSDRFRYTIDGLYSADVNVNVVSPVVSDTFELAAPGNRTLPVLANDNLVPAYVGARQITAFSPSTAGATIAISADGHSLTYSGGQGNDWFSYTVDGQYEANVSVRYPDWLQADGFVVDQNSGGNRLDVLANDFTASWIVNRWGNYFGPRAITAVGVTERGGSVTIDASHRNLTYAPPADFYGTDRFTYTVDGFLQTTATVQVIRRVRDDKLRVEPDSHDNKLNVLTNDLMGADYRGAGRITGFSGLPGGETSAGGAVTIAGDGKSVIYSPPSGFLGTDRFTYVVDDKLKAEVTVVVNSSLAELFPKFDSLSSLRQFLLDDALVAYDSLFGATGFIFPGGGGGGVDPAVELNGGDRFSETNVQVAGVDEADLLENDGSYLYVLRGQELIIARAWPVAEMQVVSRASFRGTPIGHYLNGDRLTVVSQIYEGWPLVFDDVGGSGIAVDRLYYPTFPTTTVVTVFDVSDREHPGIVQQTEIDGRYVESRRIDDQVFVITDGGGILLPAPKLVPSPAGDELRYESREQYAARVQTDFASLLEEVLPQYRSFGPDGELVRTGMLVQPEDIYQPLSAQARNLISVFSVNMANSIPGLSSTVGVLTTGASQIYGTLENLYVFEENYAWNGEDSVRTNLLKFHWDRSTGSIQFAATGQIPGRMLNQFSADEYEGFLRVATTVSNSGSGNFSNRSENLLFVLQDDEGILEPVGGLHNLALDEQIQSVRFFGAEAFVVTFRSIDPLFGLDLGDPTAPRAVGQLTLPGFSSYMQFIAEDRLLTVGRSTAGGGNSPAMVSLFNVADLTQPVLIDQYTLPSYSYSEANVDHHAFGWFADHQLLAIPSSRAYIVRVDSDGDGYRETLEYRQASDLYAFRVDPSLSERSDSGIVTLGTVSQDSTVRRGAFIEDVLYSFADDSLKAVDITDPGRNLGEISLVPVVPPEGGAVVADSAERRQQIAILTAAARLDLASKLGVRSDAIMSVVTEPVAVDEGSYDMVLRAGDYSFLYHVTSATTILTTANYVFLPPGATPQWHNSQDPYDTNRDGAVTPLDALLVINDLNRNGARELATETVVRSITNTTTMLDVNGDGYASPFDALFIINQLNQAAGLQPPTAARAAAAVNGGNPLPQGGEIRQAIASLAVAAETDALLRDDEACAALLDNVIPSGAELAAIARRLATEPATTLRARERETSSDGELRLQAHDQAIESLFDDGELAVQA